MDRPVAERDRFNCPRSQLHGVELDYVIVSRKLYRLRCDLRKQGIVPRTNAKVHELEFEQRRLRQAVKELGMATKGGKSLEDGRLRAGEGVPKPDHNPIRPDAPILGWEVWCADPEPVA